MNDIQQGLDYENISYTKEQNDKLLNEVSVAQLNARLAEEREQGVKRELEQAIKAKAVYVKTINEMSYYGGRTLETHRHYEFMSGDEFLTKHTEILTENEKLKISQEQIDRRLKYRWAQNWGIGSSAILSIIALAVWIFF